MVRLALDSLSTFVPACSPRVVAVVRETCAVDHRYRIELDLEAEGPGSAALLDPRPSSGTGPPGAPSSSSSPSFPESEEKAVPPHASTGSLPDPFDDADALEELEEEITTLAAHIHAATHRLLVLIADFDRRRGWELGGHRSCAHWLSYRTGIDLGTAREKVRTARVLIGLPLTSASMARGELSFSKVRALSRVATEDNESELLVFARGSTTAQLERLVRGFRRGSREDEAEWERRRWEDRTFSVVPDDDGMYVVRGRLPPEIGVALMRAVEAASDALYREERRGGGVGGWKLHGPDGSAETSEVPEDDAAATGRMTLEIVGGSRSGGSEKAAARRRADAVGLLAERALEAGFGKGAGEDEATDESSAPISGTRAERYQVVLHVDAETLETEASPVWRGTDAAGTGDTGAGAPPETAQAETPRAKSGRSAFEDGTRVSYETSQRLSCDCGLVRITHAPDGSILDVGRKTRTLSPAFRRALEARDRGCRFPGCGLRFTEGHHIRHWADGGETSMDNCVLLCRYHHRLMHEGGWKMDWWGQGRPVFFDPRGGVHFEGRWKDPRNADGRRVTEGLGGEEGAVSVESAVSADAASAAALLEENRRLGIEPDGWTASSRWKREVDIPDSVYFAAMEAGG
jgi:hypothetical protein